MGNTILKPEGGGDVDFVLSNLSTTLETFWLPPKFWSRKPKINIPPAIFDHFECMCLVLDVNFLLSFLLFQNGV